MTWSRVLLAGLSGVLMAGAFPPADLGRLAWVALVPLLLATWAAGRRTAFLLGWVTGTTAFGLITCWLPATLRTFTTLSPAAAAGAHLGVAAALGCYLGLFALLVADARERGVSAALPLLAALAWITTEWLRSVGPVAFPWALLGASQHAEQPLVQVAEIGGVYGLSGILVAANVQVVRLAEAIGRRAPLPWRSTAVLTGVVVLALVWGHGRIAMLDALPPAGVLRLGIVPGHVEQEAKWDPEYTDAILTRLETASLAVAATAPDVILWPEAATPFDLQEPGARQDRVRGIAAATGIPLLVGSPGYEQRDGTVVRFNRAYLIHADGTIAAGHYEKRRLVPFGEYVPFARFLPFVRPIIDAPSAMTAGGAPGHFSVGAARLGVLICYEAVFPSLAWDLARGGATVLANLTNDAWFLDPAAVAQAIAQSTLRAIETRLPVVRVANGGPSAVIDPAGRVIWQAAADSGAGHALVLGGMSRPVPWRHYPRVFLWGCLLGAALLAVHRSWGMAKTTLTGGGRAGHAGPVERERPGRSAEGR